MKNFTITVARGFGSGGKEIASAVAKNLGIHCYENRILTLASHLSGHDESKFVEVDEKLRGSYIGNVLKDLPHTLSPKPVTSAFTSDMYLFQCQAEIIRSLAESESCVIVGKCADYVLKFFPNVVSVYIEAPRAYCLKRVIERMGVSEKEAAKLIAKTDKYRADYYKFYTGGNYWTNPVNYDMTLNPARMGQDTCIELITEYCKRKFMSEE